MKSSRRQYSGALGVVVALFGLVAWETFSRGSPLVRPIIPPPSIVLLEFSRLLATAALWRDVGITMVRVAEGYALGAFIGLAVGTLVGVSQLADAALSLTLESLRPLPATALIPVAIVIFGLGSPMVVSVAAFATSWPVLLNTIDAIRGIHPTTVDTAHTLGLSGIRRVRKVLLPAALPGIFTGLRIALALSLVLVLVVEMLVGGAGLGHRLITAERTFHFPEMYATIILVGGLGAVLNSTFLAVRRVAIPWHVQHRERGNSGK